jgi:probable O-glycosylation ligase (exosortase A-associated)
MMPAEFWTRMDTLNDVQADGSFQGRLAAWTVALDCARDYFPFGAGFYSPEQPVIFNRYLPGEDFHAAHSIYFQVLGEHGYIGLAIFLVILVLPLYNATLVVRRTRNNPELAWARDLADFIRIALLAFYVGGAALSVAYFDGYLVLVALTSTLRELTAPKRATITVGRSTVLAPVSGPVARPQMAGTSGQWRRYPDGSRGSAHARRPDEKV